MSDEHIDSMVDGFKETISKLEAEVAELRQTIRGHEISADIADEQIAELKRRAETLQSTIDKYQKWISEVEQSLASKSAEIKIEKGLLCINVADLLDNLDEEVKEDLIENLSCQDDVIRRVADQIFDGWTERCSHGPKSCSASEEPRLGLDYAMRKFAKVDELAKKEIERLEEALKLEKDHHQMTRGILEKLRSSKEFSL